MNSTKFSSLEDAWTELRARTLQNFEGDTEAEQAIMNIMEFVFFAGSNAALGVAMNRNTLGAKALNQLSMKAVVSVAKETLGHLRRVANTMETKSGVH